ncbi:class II aldolase/adducin family protein [Candidatus Neomarinimicrobiota bacterium]
MKYAGVRFNTIYRTGGIPSKFDLQRLKQWCQRFADMDLAPRRDNSYAGNLSIRAEHGFVITAAGAGLGNLGADDLVQVIDINRDLHSVTVQGEKEPSSESFLHHAIYAARPQVHAVFHGHDELVLRYWQNMHLPVTEKEQPYGTLELVDEMMQTLGNHSYIVIRNHGFIALGTDMDRAGDEALEKHRIARHHADLSVG